jgi:SAM-dependent methyltransferase
VSSTDRALTSSELRDEVIRLGPWHIDIEITPEVSTATFLEAPPGTYPDDFGQITFHNPHDGFLRRLHRAFPGGLEGRSVLDCACNCGAYLYYAKEAGAGRCLGFDIRDHWIKQARFLAEHRELPSDDMRFEVSDLYDLPALEPGRFDITLFLGIFYHLPDPVTGLKIAADLTDEVMIVNTATKAGFADGLLVPDHERAERLMSGTYGLCWFPTGPQLLAGILKWLGFAEIRCSIWRHAPRQRQDLDRLEVIAARTPGFFAAWDAGAPQGPARLHEIVETHTPPGATVLALGGEDLGELHSRRLVGFAEADGSSDAEALERLEQLQGEGAQFLAALGDGIDRLGSYPALARRLEEGGRVADEPGCRIYSLRGAGEGALRGPAG